MCKTCNSNDFHYGHFVVYLALVRTWMPCTYMIMNAYTHTHAQPKTQCFRLVLLRFSKSGKRTVSDGFVKKSADSDSVSYSQRRHYKLIYTGRRMRRRCTSQAIVPGRQDATQPQANVPCARHTPHARTWTSDVAR